MNSGSTTLLQLNGTLRYFKVLRCSPVCTKLKWHIIWPELNTIFVKFICSETLLLPNMTLMYKTTTEAISLESRGPPQVLMKPQTSQICGEQIFIWIQLNCEVLYKSLWNQKSSLLEMQDKWRSNKNVYKGGDSDFSVIFTLIIRGIQKEMQYKASKRPVHQLHSFIYRYVYTWYKSLKDLLRYLVVQWFSLEHHLDLFGVQSFIS